MACRRTVVSVVAIVGLLVGFAGWGAAMESAVHPERSPVWAAVREVAGTPGSATSAADCAVTPYAAEPPNVPATMARTAEGERVSFTRTWFHAEGIWAGLSPAQRGEWYAGPEGQKVLWVRPGWFLDIDGRQLDGPAPPLAATIPEGYSSSIQATGLVFPTAGCWEVTARASNRVLRFTVLVHPAAEHPRRLSATPAATPEPTG